MFPVGFEPATLRVWDARDNHYTTETWWKNEAKIQNCSVLGSAPTACSFLSLKKEAVIRRFADSPILLIVDRLNLTYAIKNRKLILIKVQKYNQLNRYYI